MCTAYESLSASQPDREKTAKTTMCGVKYMCSVNNGIHSKTIPLFGRKFKERDSNNNNVVASLYSSSNRQKSKAFSV